MGDNHTASTSTKVNIKNKPNDKSKTVPSKKIKNNQIVNTSSTQIDSDEVFSLTSQHSSGEDFQQPKNSTKRSRIQSPNSPSPPQSKKIPIFVSTNKFEILSTEDDLQHTHCNTDNNEKNNIYVNTNSNTEKSETFKKPPPIFVRGIDDIHVLSAKLTK